MEDLLGKVENAKVISTDLIDEIIGTTSFVNTEPKPEEPTAQTVDTDAPVEATPWKIEYSFKTEDEKAEDERRAAAAPPKQPSKAKQTLAAMEEKDKIISQILARWWYFYSMWPPEEYDYAAAKTEVKCEETLVELPGYPGLYTVSSGQVIDLRPYDSCPTYHNLYPKKMSELKAILLVAMENQLAVLRKQEDYDQEVERDLVYETTKLRRTIAQFEIDGLSKTFN